MAGLLDWVKEALHPRYEVLSEAARGGMGVIFRGRDPQLDREVAIKVLLPEIATSLTTERFLREARVLARLQHQHIVPVHEAGEADGLFYYVMDFIERPTLYDRLTRGPLATSEALKLGRDLLDALEAVHAEQVIHRDIKPSNLFFGGGRTLLTDFGIAKAFADPRASLTRTGHFLGTPNYMAPEQLAAGEATTRSDLYQAAMVIYEAFTGRQWKVGLEPRAANWSGVPRYVARVLARGLALHPSERWPNATTFRRNLWHTRERRYQIRAAWLTGGALLVGGLAVWLSRLGAPKPVAEGRLTIQIAAPTYAGAERDRWLTDSIPIVYARLMASAPDFQVCTPRQKCAHATLTLHTSINLDDDARLALRVAQEDATGRVEEFHRGSAQPLDLWRQEVNRAVDAGLRAIWRSNSPLAEWLPLEALPRAGRFDAFLEAEHLLYRAQWSDARTAYERAFAADTTCLICSWRITEIQRWLVEPPDSTHLLRVYGAIDRFPDHYQPLIRARWLPIDQRLALLDSATSQWKGFPYAWFLLGEELYHRGPLVGRSRVESISAFERAALLDPTFGPVWEHLAWVNTAAGFEAAARDALAQYDILLEDEILADGFARTMRALTGLGIAWRFSQGQALSQAATVLREPNFAEYPDVGAGPRMLAVFESRRGMIELASAFLEMNERRDVRFASDVAIVLADLALGRVREARRRLGDMDLQYPAFNVAGFALKLTAALSLIDSSAVDVDRSELSERLSSFERAGDAGAGWFRALLEVGSKRQTAASTLGRSSPLAAILQAVIQSNPTTALESTSRDRLPLIAEMPRRGPGGFQLEHLPDRFYRTILKFYRASWYTQLGNSLAAADELLYHEASDMTGVPLGLPEAFEIDMAFGTLARWRRALLLENIRVGDACADFTVVSARWRDGDDVYRARADSASRALRRLGCLDSPEIGW